MDRSHRHAWLNEFGCNGTHWRVWYWQILLQKSFCTRDQNFSWLYTRLSCKDVGDLSPEDKLAGDLGNVIEPTSTGVRRSGFFTAEKLAPGNLGLLQQYRHEREVLTRR
jgi:hypothetical protein